MSYQPKSIFMVPRRALGAVLGLLLLGHLRCVGPMQPGPTLCPFALLLCSQFTGASRAAAGRRGARATRAPFCWAATGIVRKVAHLNYLELIHRVALQSCITPKSEEVSRRLTNAGSEVLPAGALVLAASLASSIFSLSMSAGHVRVTRSLPGDRRWTG